MTNTSVPLLRSTDGRKRRPSRYLSVAGVLLMLTLGWAGAGTVSASEFNPDPGATASATCVAANLGTDITVTMTNVAGLADAHFTVDSFAYGPTTHVVAPGQTAVFVIDGVPDNTELGLTVTADYGVVLTQTFVTDCYGYVGQLVPRCDGADAYLDVHVQRTGELAANVYLDVDGQTVDSLLVEDTWDTSLAVATEVPLDVVVANNRDGLIAGYSAPIHCETSGTVPDTTVPDTTIPEGATPTEVPQVLEADQTLQSAVDQGALVDSLLPPGEEAAATELAFTGGETILLAVIGGLLLAAGLATFSLNRRVRR